MNKREFIIGLGAGLLIASTLSLAGYLSALSKWGEPQEAAPAIGQEYEKSGEPVAQSTEGEQTLQNEPPKVEPVKPEPPKAEPEKVATKQEETPESVLNETADNGDDGKTSQGEENPSDKEEASVEESSGQTSDSEEPVPAIEPEQVPQSESQPEPQPKPQTAPQPEPAPQPQPAPQPEPMPQPEPTPQPAPQPAPQPVPQPAPQPAPQPEDSGTVKVTIGQDSTNAEIAAEMSRQGLVSSAEEFAAYLNQTGLYVKYDTGTYEIDRGASFEEIVDEIRR